MMLTHCGNNVRNRYSGCVFSVKDIVPVPLKTSRNPWYVHKFLNIRELQFPPAGGDFDRFPRNVLGKNGNISPPVASAQIRGIHSGKRGGIKG